MITPFVNESVAKGISHGLNSFGYDLRCGSEFKIFTNIKGATADPKNFSEDNFITVNPVGDIYEVLGKIEINTILVYLLTMHHPPSVLLSYYVHIVLFYLYIL